jgi:hypothetical protein
MAERGCIAAFNIIYPVRNRWYRVLSPAEKWRRGSSSLRRWTGRHFSRRQTIAAKLSFFIQKYLLCVQILFSFWMEYLCFKFANPGKWSFQQGRNLFYKDWCPSFGFTWATHTHTHSTTVSRLAFFFVWHAAYSGLQTAQAPPLPSNKASTCMNLLLSCKRRGNCICTGHEV